MQLWSCVSDVIAHTTLQCVGVWLYHHAYHPMLCRCGYTAMPTTPRVGVVIPPHPPPHAVGVVILPRPPPYAGTSNDMYTHWSLSHYFQVSLVILVLTVAAGFVCWKYKHFIKRRLLSLRQQLHDAYRRGMSQYGRISELLGQNAKIHPE